MKMFTMSLLVLLIMFPAFGGGQNETSDDGMMEKSEASEGTMMEKPDTEEAPMMMAPSPVMDFKGMQDAMMLAKEKPTVLFFYATWCPTCQAAMKSIEAAPEKLSGINLLIVDYDNSDDLQKKYGVTYQHTFVQINPSGKAIAKWNGGNADEILMKTEMSEM